MKALRFKTVTMALTALAVACGMASCQDKEEKAEQEASIVNVEKGVASPVWNPESDNQQVPVDTVMEQLEAPEIPEDAAPGE